MKKWFLFLSMLTGSLTASTQVAFEKFPSQYQFFPRNNFNKGTISIKGISENDQNFAVSLLLFEDDQIIERAYIPLGISNDFFEYTFEIDSRLSQYSIQAYLYNSATDSLLVKESDKMVCGDVHIIYGQSNCIGYQGIDTMVYNSAYMDYLRNFSVDNSKMPVESEWSTGYYPYGNLGVFGLILGKKLIEKSRAPILLISGAVGGARLDILNKRNEDYPDDPSTPYGRLLQKCNMAGVTSQVKSLIWRQGEAEAASTAYPHNYGKELDSLILNLQKDFVSMKHIFSAQNNLMDLPFYDLNSGNWVREAQRRFQNKHPAVELISTVDLNSYYDGLHYGYNGHYDFAQRVSNLAGAKIYNDAPNPQLSSPNIVSAKELRPTGDTLELTFQSGQKLSYGNPQYGLGINDAFKLDDGSSARNVSVFDNKVILVLPQGTSTDYLTYLPSSTNFSDWPKGYRGPQLFNEEGIAALTFFEFPVSKYQPENIKNLTRRFTQKELILRWDKYEFENRQIRIEKYKNGLLIKELWLDTSDTVYTDNEIEFTENTLYRYDISVVQDTFHSKKIIVEQEICKDFVASQFLVEVCDQCDYLYRNAVSLDQIPQKGFTIQSQESVLLLPGFSISGQDSFRAEIFRCYLLGNTRLGHY